MSVGTLGPDSQRALNDAIRLHQSGRLAEAEQLYRRILSLAPDNVDTLHLLGMLASQCGQHEAAIPLIGKAIALSKSRPVAAFHNNIGLAYRGLGKLDEAAQHFQQAARLKRDYAEAHSNLAAVLQAQGKLDEAAAAYRRALNYAPGHPNAQYGLGVVLKELGQLDEAAAALQRVVQIAPNFPDAQNSLGAVLKEQGKHDQAVGHFRQAIALNPDFGNAHFNLAMVLREQGKPEDAAVAYRQALKLMPDDAQAHVDYAMTLLLGGDFAAGWKEYEWRWRTQYQRPRPFAQPLWDGGDIAGKTILLHSEQGLGDTLQFVRYAPMVAQRGARIVLEVQKSLASLMKNLDGVAEVIAQGDALPPFDLHCPLMSLPLAFRTAGDTIPGDTPYLKADAERAAVWQAKLAALPGLKVGLVWAGAPRPGLPAADAIDRRRSLNLDQLASFAGLEGVSFISLQMGPPSEQAKKPPAGLVIHDWTGEIGDFADTAALVSGLDLVIGVDTSVIHLAGGLGKPVWMFNRFDTCWRWQLERKDSPWYPGLRQFRQPAPGIWEAPISAMRDALTALTARRA